MPNPAAPAQISPEDVKRKEVLSGFTLNLLKAMLKTGYYAPDHPGAKDAKEGLFAEFTRVIEGREELTYTRRHERGKRDVVVEGIFPEILSLSSVITPGTSELFIPKFLEYFSRQNLVSFSLKAEITQEEFEKFVDIMSETPKKELGKEELGQLLTKKILENDIFNVSTIFDVDLVGVTRKLPWRVELVITRLRKDLSLIPLFKSYKQEELEETKAKVIADIIRPLNNPQVLKDFLVNCDLVSQDLQNLGQLDIESYVFDSLKQDTLLATIRALQEEHEKSLALLEISSENQVARSISERAKELLKKVSVRLVRENIPDGLSILLSLHSQDILSMEDLSEEAKRVVIDKKMADGFLKDENKFVQGLKNVKDGAVLERHMDQLLRITTELFQRELYPSALKIVNAVFDLSEERKLPNEFLSDATAPVTLSRLKEGFLTAPKESREEIARVLSRFGLLSVPPLLEVLLQSEEKGVRNSACNTLAGLGDQAGDQLLKKLENETLPWFLHRNLITIMTRMKHGPAIPAIEKHSAHADERVRETAIESLALLQGMESEPRLLKALTDPEAKVKNRAFVLLKSLRSTHRDFVQFCLRILARREARAEEESDELQILACNSLTAMESIPAELRAEIEETLSQAVAPEEKSLAKIFKKKEWKVKSPNVQAAIREVLAKIGTENSARS